MTGIQNPKKYRKIYIMSIELVKKNTIKNLPKYFDF